MSLSPTQRPTPLNLHHRKVLKCTKHCASCAYWHITPHAPIDTSIWCHLGWRISLSLYSSLFLPLYTICCLSPPPHTHTFYPIYLIMLPEWITDISKTQTKNCQNQIKRFWKNCLEGQTDWQKDRLMIVNPPPPHSPFGGGGITKIECRVYSVKEVIL
jgi:hypothetical protein